jgi:hypothetical protein
MNPQHVAPKVPTDVGAAIRAMKAEIRSTTDVKDAFDRLSDRIEARVEEIEQLRDSGQPVWPEVDHDTLAAGTASDETVAAVRDRGCLVVRGHFPRSQALEWDSQLVDYVEANDFDAVYRGPGDDFFGTLGAAASRPEIFPLYWSRPQMLARQDERTATVQSFLNHRWDVESEGTRWFNPDQDCMYPDRVRRRRPGTDSGGLGAHTDSGSLERWLLPAYRKVFRHVFNGDIENYNPWDAAYRTDVHEYEGGTTMCSMFRTFQGWTALSDQQNDQGVLHVIPIPEAMAYILLRALQDDVPEDELCGVTPRHVLPVSQEWHPLLMRALTPIPDLQAGDSVWWHCDVVHSVAPVEDQQGWGNVMYIPAAPQCAKNEAYAASVAEALRTGMSPTDFPDENYEVDWVDRFHPEDLNAVGRRALGLV